MVADSGIQQLFVVVGRGWRRLLLFFRRGPRKRSGNAGSQGGFYHVSRKLFRRLGQREQFPQVSARKHESYPGDLLRRLSTLVLSPDGPGRISWFLRENNSEQCNQHDSV